ncbi:MEDS domain-containing protein [Actinomadura verrucosospora]
MTDELRGPTASRGRMTDAEFDALISAADAQQVAELRRSVDTAGRLSGALEESALGSVRGKRPWFAVRPVSTIRPGDHAWLAFSAESERNHVIGAFVRDAFNMNEKMVYITDAGPAQLSGVLPRHGYDLPALTRCGQLCFIPREKAYLDSRGRFDVDRMSHTIEQQANSAFDQGFRAVRMTTDLTWTLKKSERRDFKRILGCEDRLGETIFSTSMAMTICQVDRRYCTPDELDTLDKAHEIVVEPNPEFDDGVLRITRTYSPLGLRLEGEVDAARWAILTEVLGAGEAPNEPMHLDLSQLGFIDLGGLHAIARHASRLPENIPLILDNIPPQIISMIEMVGWHRLPGLVRGRL